MNRKIKTMAGMAICLLEVLTTISCSKDEFFGLEDSVVVDSVTKLEIAMSQEFADYTKACFRFIEELNLPVDTTERKLYCIIDGKPVYVKTGTSSYQDVLESMKRLKTTFPELAKADVIDYDDILMIALSNNESLGIYETKFHPAVTRGGQLYNSRSWFVQLLNNAWSEGYYCDGDLSNMTVSQDGKTWNMNAWWNTVSAINQAIYLSQETHVTTGGFFWGDGSGTSMISSQAEGDLIAWPRFATTGLLRPEADFMVRPSGNLALPESNIGQHYFQTGRIHYIYNYEGQYAVYY